MAVLKDVFCENCGAHSDKMLEADQLFVFQRCPRCRATCKHESRCTGGQKLKCYAGSYDGRDWSGDMEFMGIEATYEDGTPVMEADGTRTDAKYKTDFDARINEKRKRKRFEHEQATGSGSLHYHN